MRAPVDLQHLLHSGGRGASSSGGRPNTSSLGLEDVFFRPAIVLSLARSTISVHDLLLQHRRLQGDLGGSEHARRSEFALALLPVKIRGTGGVAPCGSAPPPELPLTIACDLVTSRRSYPRLDDLAVAPPSPASVSAFRSGVHSRHSGNRLFLGRVGPGAQSHDPVTGTSRDRKSRRYRDEGEWVGGVRLAQFGSLGDAAGAWWTMRRIFAGLLLEEALEQPTVGAARRLTLPSFVRIFS